jgi:glycosyltransferase involved in cell wall biosynthesis
VQHSVLSPQSSALSTQSSALKASVVIPCYNQGRFLADAVGSLIAQTEPRWEAVIIDDGSTDNTLALAHEQAGRDERVRVLTQANRGLGGSRNAGIAATGAPAVLCLDADDMIAPTFLERTLASLQADPQIGFVSGDVQFFGDEHNRWSGGEPTAERLRWDCRLVSASLFRRAAWREAGGFAERTAMPSYEDWDFWLRLVERGWRGARVAEPLVLVRRVRGGMLHGTQRDDLVLRARLVAAHPALFPTAFGPWASAVLREAERRGDALLWWRWFGWYAALVARHAPRELPRTLLRPAMKRLAPGQQMYARRLARLLRLSQR